MGRRRPGLVAAARAVRAGLTALGAHETIDTGEPHWGLRVRECAAGGVDVAVDFTGRETWPETIGALRRGGRLPCGSTSGDEPPTDLHAVWSRELSVLGTNGWVREDLDRCVQLVERGLVEPPIHDVFPLERAAEAFAELEERRVFGKVVVVP